MLAHPHSERSLALLSALNRRGIRGRLAKTYLRKYSQRRIALQIDYYDHEIVYRAKLPEWAATPWLAHRIRHVTQKPEGFVPTNRSLSALLRQIPYRPSGRFQ